MSISSKTPRHIHLNLNLRVQGFHRGGWRHATSFPDRFQDIEFYLALAQAAEAAQFDSIFLADSPALSKISNAIAPLAHALEPFTILSALAAGTSHIGLIGTTSSTYSDLLNLANRTAALDFFSGGRVGVNFVTSAGNSVSRNFGHDNHPDYPRRYARAQSFLDAILALWDGTAHAEGRQRRPVDIADEFFQIDDVLTVPSSPQGRPLIVQAGASEEGRDFAAASAEAIYSGSSTIENGQRFYRDLKTRAEGFGRSPDDLRILPGVMPFIADTEAGAKRLHAELEELAIYDTDPIAVLGNKLQVDLSKFDPDGPFPFEAMPPVAELSKSVTGQLRLIEWAQQENLTIRELAQKSRSKLGGVQWQIIGTGEQVADELELWFREGAADGFNVLPPHYPAGGTDFFDQVVPELQRRGLVRKSYEGKTLRDNLGLGAPSR